MATRIALTTFAPACPVRYADTDVDAVLSRVDRDAYTWLHVVHTDLATSTRILEHFGLPGILAEHLDAQTPLELHTSSSQYLFKKFRFLEDAATPTSAAREGAGPGFLIRPNETDRLTESSASVIVGDKYLLLFEPQASPIIAQAVDVILHREREVRERGIDYLTYRLAKVVFVDNYLALLRRIMDRLHELEGTLLDGTTEAATYREVTSVRRELNPFARSLTYMAESTGTMQSEKPEVLSQSGRSYFAENLRTDTDRLETEFSILRDRTAQLIQMYRDNVNAQLNSIMRTLTAISAMFLPLSFITSFYGMNFNMPALRWSGSFYVVVGVMLSIVVGSLVFARRHKWI